MGYQFSERIHSNHGTLCKWRTVISVSLKGKGHSTVKIHSLPFSTGMEKTRLLLLLCGNCDKDF